jgi:hypothetical protein
MSNGTKDLVIIYNYNNLFVNLGPITANRELLIDISKYLEKAYYKNQCGKQTITEIQFDSAFLAFSMEM